MKDEFDFSKGVKNPYVDKIKQAITIRLDPSIIKYYEKESKELRIPYQQLIQMALWRDMDNPSEEYLKMKKEWLDMKEDEDEE